MKKKSCLMLAVMLAMLQIIAVFAVVPASAASLGRTYDIVLSQETPTIDGNVDACWESVVSSESFVCSVDAGNTGNADLDIKFKAIWTPAENGKINLYILAQGTGYETTGPGVDGIRVYLKTGDTSSYTNVIRFDGSGTGTGQTYGGYNHGFYSCQLKKDDTSRTFTYEFTCQIDKTESIGLDIYVLDGIGWSNIDYFSWNGTSTSGQYHGVCNIVEDQLPADVYVTATNGASIRLDTADKTKSGIRFATSVAVPDGATIKKTGTLVLPTATLTAKNIVDADFNHASLKAAGLEEGIDYYDIDNVGNEWVDGQEGTWYGTLFNIQAENFDRAISGIGYAVVEVDGVEYTVYAEYNSAVHSRSIKQVAELVIDQYEEGSDEYELLLGFTQTEETQP